MQLSTTKQAWIALGRSKRGRMVGSEAVIGLPSSNTVGYYLIDGYSKNNVYSTTTISLSGTSITQSSSGTILQFTQNLADGRFPLSNSSSATFIYAIGCSNSWGNQHCSQGSFSIQLSPCGSGGSLGEGTTSTVSSTLSRRTFERHLNIHGYLAALCWGFLVPLAVSASRFRETLNPYNQDKQGYQRQVHIWFIIHRTLNGLAFILTFTFFAVVVRTLHDWYILTHETSNVNAMPPHFKY